MESAPKKAEGVVSGLTVVIAGSRSYVGVLSREGLPEEDRARGCVVLKNAIELMTVPERGPEGVQMRVMPLMVSPSDEPVPSLVVLPTAHFDRSSDQGLIRVYSSLTGKSPLLVPGGRVRLPS